MRFANRDYLRKLCSPIPIKGKIAAALVGSLLVAYPAQAQHAPPPLIPDLGETIGDILDPDKPLIDLDPATGEGGVITIGSASGTIPAVPTTYDFIADAVELPFQAQDLHEDDRIFKGKLTHSAIGEAWQRYAYDLGISRKQSDGTWLDHHPDINWEIPKNSDFYIHGKPVRAMSGGHVAYCWRNAPSNPRPYSPALDHTGSKIELADQKWLHPSMREEKMFGSGNFVVIREDSGRHVHYAHGQPGSISQDICPHDEELLSPSSWETDSAVPPAQQRRVKQGDVLFKAGNTGNSSAPHLHVERTMPDNATSVPLGFKRGLSAQLDQKDHRVKTSTTWRPLVGHLIPRGPTLVWPPRGGNKVWSWHRQSPHEWSDTFAHMADSGYMLDWIDGYSVARQPYFASVWRKATDNWYGFAMMNRHAFQGTKDWMADQKFAPTHVDSIQIGNEVFYNAIFRNHASKNFISEHGQSERDFSRTYEAAMKAGMSPQSISISMKNRQPLYTSLFRKQDIGGWVWIPAIPQADYQKTYDENQKLNRNPIYVNAYKSGNTVFYSVLFAEKPTGGQIHKHGFGGNDYSTYKSRIPVRAISGVDGAVRNYEYIGLWRD